MSTRSNDPYTQILSYWDKGFKHQKKGRRDKAHNEYRKGVVCGIKAILALKPTKKNQHFRSIVFFGTASLAAICLGHDLFTRLNNAFIGDRYSPGCSIADLETVLKDLEAQERS